jgi:hypothetical protein
MTTIESLVTTLRFQINDTNSSKYSDEFLTVYLKKSVADLSTTKYPVKLEVTGSNIYVKSTTTSISAEDEYVLLLNSEILVAYFELNKYSKQAIDISDIRGSIDTRNIAKEIVTNIKMLEQKLKDFINNSMSGTKKSSLLPKNMTFQTYYPEKTFTDTTFNTRESNV